MKIRKAVIPAAGLGIRFLPATKAQPKEMLPIVDKPTIQYIVEEAVSAGIEDIIIISGRGKRTIEDHFDKSYELEDVLAVRGNEAALESVRRVSDMANICYIRQKEPKGLGHAILCAKAFVGDQPFAVMLGDDIVDSRIPCIGQLIAVYEQRNATVLGVQKVPKERVSDYGIVDGEPISETLYRVRDLVEKPERSAAPSDIAILGRYIITPEIFEFLATTRPGKGGEIQLTDGLKQLSYYQSMYACVFEGKRYDVGKKMGFLEATVEFALQRDELKKEFREYLDQITRRPYS